jgi:hypothetical protein
MRTTLGCEVRSDGFEGDHFEWVMWEVVLTGLFLERGQLLYEQYQQ